MNPQDFQDFMGVLRDTGRSVRSDYHLTLGQAITALESLKDPNAPVVFDWHGFYPGAPNSYRGYYADLALDWGEDPIVVDILLRSLVGSLGQEFGGYKGGSFLMGADTPLWAARYGALGRAIIDIKQENGVVTLETKEID